MTDVAIIVPGIMGSVLSLDGEMIWPGPVSSLIFPYGKMQELMREDLVATDCIRTFSVTVQYQSLIDDLMTCGFDEANGTLIVAAYDWRKDNALAAETLAGHIDRAVQKHGATVEISLIAHSMGGLVSRYYLESGHFSTRPGFDRVRRLVTLGTPHNGAALALPMVLGYEKQLFLSADQVLQAASDPRYPAAYQLLPPRTELFAWRGDAGADVLNVYDPDVARQLGLVAANLAAAERFRAALDMARRPAHTRYFCFVGTQQSTATHAVVRPLGTARLQPFGIEDRSGGDGTVPTWSGFLPGIERKLVGGKHATIYQNDALRHVLAVILGKPGVLAGIPDHVEVAVRDPVVEPEDAVHLTIGFGRSIGDFDGVITVERAQIDAATGRPTGFDPPQSIYPIEYKGVGVESLSLTFKAPDRPGFYRVAVRNDVGAAPSGYDELIVQQVI